MNVIWCDVFNVGRATQWAFVDCLGVNPKADPETIRLAIWSLDKWWDQRLAEILPEEPRTQAPSVSSPKL